MKDPFAVMPQPTAAMFNLLRDLPRMKDFILIGGTGLALHIGHRRSEGLDFITLRPKLPRAALTSVEEFLRQPGHILAPLDDPEAGDDFENAGMDIRDYSQNWLIDGKVKVTFITAEDHHRKVLTEHGDGNSFRIGSFTELCQLKVLVAASRSKSRDWLDLFVLDRDYGFGLARWKEAYDKAGLLTGAHFENALKRICGGGVSPDDKEFNALMRDPPLLRDIVSYFRTLRDKYEVAIAKAALSKPM